MTGEVAARGECIGFIHQIQTDLTGDSLLNLVQKCLMGCDQLKRNRETDDEIKQETIADVVLGFEFRLELSYFILQRTRGRRRHRWIRWNSLVLTILFGG